LRHLIVLKRTGADTPMVPDRDRWWHEPERQSQEAPTEITNAEQVLMVIYTPAQPGA
jgi:acetyl-CoA synthetase